MKIPLFKKQIRTGGDVFVLDMRKPVKIVYLAYKMTHLNMSISVNITL